MHEASERRAAGQAYPWPKLPRGDAAPVWTGHGFQVGTSLCPVLSYAVTASNWTDDLTVFHEDSAGEHHPIDIASRQHAIGELKQYVQASSPVILEVGCSSGYLLHDLRQAFREAFLIGSDFVRGPLDALAARLPDLPLLQFDLVQCPLPTGSVDAVILLNVLEHVEDHEGALRQLYRILKSGGVAVIEVPAGPHLYDVYDKVLMHWRRYTLKELRRLTEQTGFRTRSASHLGFFVYPAFVRAKRAGQRMLTELADIQRAWVARNIRRTRSSLLLRAVMGLEMALGRLVSYGVGVRCLLTCEKPNE
jgi:ubiquinone/menaquinone biosynthesis C-methylase UbiE